MKNLGKIFTCQWKRNERLIKNTSTYSRGKGMPILHIKLWGKTFLHRDQRNTSTTTLSESDLSPFVECSWWFWDFFISGSCNWVAGMALTIFSPAKQSSYLQRIENDENLMISTRPQISKWSWKHHSEIIFQDHYHHESFWVFHKSNKQSLLKKQYHTCP